MRLEVTGRHMVVTPTLRRLVERKLGKLDRLLNDRAVSAQVVLSDVPRARRADMTLHARGEHFLHGAAEAATWEASVGQAVERLVQQAKKIKGRWQSRKRRLPPDASAAEPASAGPARPAGRSSKRRPTILRTARSIVQTMSVTDAARAVEASADKLVVFRQVGTEEISVLYRREGGDLTLLEIEP